MYLKYQRLVQEDERKQKCRKWVRYEREHSPPPGISTGMNGMKPVSRSV